MPAKSKAQFRLMKAAENNPKFAKRVGISPDVAAEYTQSNVKGRSYAKLPERLKDGGPSLSVGRGEKLPADQGAGLTAKGRAKYNRETGSNLKAPQPQKRFILCANEAYRRKKRERIKSQSINEALELFGVLNGLLRHLWSGLPSTGSDRPCSTSLR
jgi:Domain of unknown function (DUF6321)